MTIKICKVLSMETPLDPCSYLDMQYKVPFCRYDGKCPFKIKKEIEE